ncbi:folylpolyglutamate synthase [Cordyceps fumosorosea ARSEF 2679]|uniref:tetrahydrofolate synthase n=1 Tax=Cordyceps fumosorosea (strain ARSEF 2679) TaxID=1081104 RepID=A0A168AM82_CORFA|nr:folylpolyglutamate synthase [Cordyceps fumosorosea ARSEF 2679]OAA68935.1 folylpolyglutamate synthase [Cordyceps fumosorosea ARSEF 2679]
MQHCISRLRATTSPICTASHHRAVSTSYSGVGALYRMSSSAATGPRRDYDAALAHLSMLASNRAVTTLFEKPRQDAAAAAQPPSSSSPPAQDLNAQAIPEMLMWLRRAGYTPQDLAAMRHIHVAGTKGKGSVCAFATSLLRAAGPRVGPVGTYTSPHLVSPRERIAIDGAPVSRAVFAAAFWELWDRFTAAAVADGQRPRARFPAAAVADGQRPRAVAEGPASKPFYFRFLTILAWHVFLRAGVRDVVVECGIGGEHDATNVLPAAAVSAAVVTQLGVDHVAMLGGTVEEIAWHKAGVFKPGVAAFTLGDAPASVMAVLRRRAAEKGARLVEVDAPAADAWEGVVVGGGEAPLLLGGDFQRRNQALAVLAVQEHLGVRDEAASTAETLARLPEGMAAALRGATLRGRCEVLPDEAHGVRWLLDGAHTRDSITQVARWLVKSLDGDGEETVALVFNQQDRDAPALLAHLVEAVQAAAEAEGGGRGEVVFSRALFTRNEQEAAEHDGDLGVQKALAETMARLAPGCQVSVFDNVRSAVAEARRAAAVAGGGKVQKVLVTGSLHLVGGIMRVIEPDSLL